LHSFWSPWVVGLGFIFNTLILTKYGDLLHSLKTCFGH
jgi:hypothetical protein